MLARAKERVMQALEPTLFKYFHKRLYHRHQWMDVRWMGVPVQKVPSDLWILQELLVNTRPQVIIETGTYDGGSTLYLAHLLDLLGEGEIISIDIEPRAGRPVHPRIEYVAASSVDANVLAMLRERTAGKRSMVILDSDHRAAHVREELKVYPNLVTSGCYLIIEDTNINGHPVSREFGPGPMEAMAEWLESNPPFENDQSCEKFLVTFHPKGYWRRK